MHRLHTHRVSFFRSTSLRRFGLALVAVIPLAASTVQAAFVAQLQGQSFGSTNWITGNLNGWAELDFIPMRVYLTGGPASNQTITVQFDHTKTAGTLRQGVQNLYDFTSSPNVVITSGPTPNTPSGQDVWSYTFIVSMTDNAPGFVDFSGRLAAGAHLFGGSSLMIKGTPSLGQLKVHGPAANAGSPDLSIVKTGPTNANPGQIITYSITYQNKLSGSTATGVQITDFLPDQVAFVSCTGNCAPLGNTITWDLGNLARGASGIVTYQVAVTNLVTTGFAFHNDASIAGAENDANSANNFSSVTTTVTSNCLPPSIVADPADSAACPGDTVTLSVAANGSATLQYQWRKDGADIGGATSDTLTLNSLGATDSGSFDVVISNLCGTVTSSPAMLSVGGAVITSNPTGDAKCVGDSMAFLVEAGGQSLTYQWRKDGVDIGAATNNLYEIASVSSQDAGGYDVTVSGACGSTNSSVATLTVNLPTTITGHPASVAVCEGQVVDLSVGASGSGLLTHQWRKDGADIVGATNSTYEISAAAAGDAGGYDVVVIGACGSVVTSAVATVTVNTATIISQDPASVVVCAGAPVMLSVSASGSAPAYQWHKDSNDIPGATDSTYSIASASAADAGSYNVTVTGACGSPVVSAAASVTVKPAPVAVDDNYTTSEDVPLTVSAAGVLDNDTNPGGDPLAAELVDGPTHGTLTLNADGSFAYAPNTHFYGTDGFTYRAQTTCGASDPATASITVTHVNHAPVANDDSYNMTEDAQLTVAAPGVLANDTDLDGDALTATLIDGPSHGVMTLNPDGSFTYTPLAGFFGVDEFTYEASDGLLLSATATVTINIAHVNHSPVAVDDSLTIAENSGSHAIDVLANDSDPDHDALTITQVSQPANGSAAISGGGTGLTYTPNSNFSGTDSFTYTISDGNGGTATATVSVTVVQVALAPVAQDDSYQVQENDTLQIAAPGVLANDTNTQAVVLTAMLAAGPAHGSVTLNTDGSFTYVPDDNYSGSDSFTYKANNGTLDSNVATVHLNVSPVHGAADVDLYVKSASARINRAKGSHDSLTLRGQINPRGMNDNLSNATVAVEINGVSLLPPQILDSRGRARGTVDSIKTSYRLRNSNGAYNIKVSGMDLGQVLGLANHTEAGVTVVTARLTINGAGLDIPVTVAKIECPYRTTKDKASSVRFNFRKNRTLTGVFNCTKTIAFRRGRVAVRVQGVMTSDGSGPILPNGNVIIHISNAQIAVPVTALVAAGTNYKLVPQIAPSAGTTSVTKFSVRGTTHTFSLNIASGDIPLPAPNPGSPLKYQLPILVEVQTANGPMFFESIVELKRTTGKSTLWKR